MFILILIFVIFCLLSVICKQQLLHVNSYTCTFTNQRSLTRFQTNPCHQCLLGKVLSGEVWLYSQANVFSYAKIIQHNFVFSSFFQAFFGPEFVKVAEDPNLSVVNISPVNCQILFRYNRTTCILKVIVLRKQYFFVTQYNRLLY